MTASTTAAPTPNRLTSHGTLSGRRRYTNLAATALIWAALAVASIPLGLLILWVARKGLPVLSWSYLTESIPTRSTSDAPGIGPAVVGTLITTALATAIAVPLGILGAIYLNEYGAESRLAQVIRFLANVLTGVPSIVMGLFIYTIWVVPLKGAGLTAFSGSLALAFLILPVIIRSTEEMLKLVPQTLREASLALGASRARTIVTVVLPAALPGITSGALLAVARAAGETAPVLFTVGFTNSINWNPFSGTNVTLAQLIFSNASAPYEGAQQRAYAAALTLIMLVLLLTVIARLVAARLTVR